MINTEKKEQGDTKRKVRDNISKKNFYIKGTSNTSSISNFTCIIHDGEVTVMQMNSTKDKLVSASIKDMKLKIGSVTYEGASKYTILQEFEIGNNFSNHS